MSETVDLVAPEKVGFPNPTQGVFLQALIMELITILLSGLLDIISPAGLILERTAENALRKQIVQADKLEVRLENSPIHQLLQGKIDRLRIAGRALKLKNLGIRVAALELETDVIQLNSLNLNQKHSSFKQPLQAGLRLVLNQQDINQFLRSPQFNSFLGAFKHKSTNYDKTSKRNTYKFSGAQVKFITNKRLALKVKVHEQKQDQPLLIQGQSDVNILSGRKIQLIQPIVFVNREQVAPRFV